MGTAVARCVVFDLGNVLIRWDPHAAIAAAVGVAEATRFLAADDFDFLGWNHLQDAGRGWDEAEAAVARSHPHWHRHAVAYRTHFDRSLLGPVEDNVAVLRDLHAAGVPVVGLTNWSSELFPHALARFDFLGLLDDIVVSGDEGLAKPDPAIFEALRQRVARPLAECVLVDDSAANIAAAATAGLDTIHFTGEPVRPLLRDRGLPV